MLKNLIPLLTVFTLYILVLMASSALSEPIEVKVVDVYDIDTFFIDLPGVTPLLGKRVPVRVRGIDGPEIKGQCLEEKELAEQGRKFAERLFYTYKFVQLDNLERGKYFRIVADVYLNNQLFANLAIKAGLARPYDGTTRLPWCTTGETK